jgi:uncharacterized protein (DUF2336 family)
MQSTLSCLLEIEALSNEPSSDKRREVLHRVTDLFFLTSDQQEPGDIVAFGNVMERVAYELEIEARAELAERISSIDKAPRRLIRRLAIDDIAVARPVLERSSVLTNDDLVQIAKSRGQTHLHAISKRPNLAAPVTDVIVQRGEAPVLHEVTRNKGAVFSGAGLQTLAEKSRFDGELLTTLGKRNDLPPDIMRDIKQRVMEKIGNEMAGKYSESDIADLDNLIEESAENINIGNIQQINDKLQVQIKKGEFGEDDLAALAKTHRLTEIVQALSLLTGLDGRMVSHCLLKADIAALGILCKANDFKSPTYLALIQTRVGKSGLASRDVARSMREYDLMTLDNAKRTLRFLKLRCSTELPKNSEPNLGDTNLWRAHDQLTDNPQRGI